MENTDNQSNKPKKWAIGGIVISWVSIWFILFSIIGFIVWVGILGYLCFKKSYILWYLILSSWLLVPCFHFVSGTFNYFLGDGKIKVVGSVISNSYIDNETRAPLKSSGCLVLGYEPFVFMPNNYAIRLCTSTFGYQKGSYVGVFPDESESFAILSKGDTIQAVSKDGRLSFKYSDSEFNPEFKMENQADSLIVKMVNNECLIFEVLSKKVKNKGNFVYLFDIKKQSIFKRYYKKILG